MKKRPQQTTRANIIKKYKNDESNSARHRQQTMERTKYTHTHTHEIRLNSIKAYKHPLLFLCKQATLKEQE